MPRATNQKQRLFALYRLLYEETDENHALSMEEILDRLADIEIPAERRAIYDDIEVMNNQFVEKPKDKNAFHFHIAKTKTNPIRYYLVNREFDLPDLKLLVESVRAFKFLSKGTTKRLVRNLEGLCSKPQLEGLRAKRYAVEYTKRREYTSKKVNMTSSPRKYKARWNKKTASNADVFTAMDVIQDAIKDNKCITFDYREYALGNASDTGRMVRVQRKSRRYDLVSPLALTYQEGNYYLIAAGNSEKLEGLEGMKSALVRYRIDKMHDIVVRRYERMGVEQFKELELKNGGIGYLGRLISADEGRTEQIELICENSLLDAIIDQFGEELHRFTVDNNHFSITPLVVVNSQFFGWLFSLGKGARIKSPVDLAMEVKRYLTEIQKMYQQIDTD